MTARIINLRQRRKQKARDEQRAQADNAARLHGRSKAERHLTGAENRRENRHLDGHKLDDDE